MSFITIRTPDKKNFNVFSSGIVWLVAGGKLYTEAGADSIDKALLADSTTAYGWGSPWEFDISAHIPSNGMVIWYGEEPKRSAKSIRDRDYKKRFSGKTVTGVVTSYSYTKNENPQLNGVVLESGNESYYVLLSIQRPKVLMEYVKPGDILTVQISFASFPAVSDLAVFYPNQIVKAGEVIMKKGEVQL